MSLLKKISISLGTLLLLFLLTAPNANAQSCDPWDVGYEAECFSGTESEIIDGLFQTKCAGYTSVKGGCNSSLTCPNNKTCCQWLCYNKGEATPTCSSLGGTCSKVADCDAAENQTTFTADCGEQAGQGESALDYTCCIPAEIVTPEGDAPGATSTAPAEDEIPEDPSIGAGCKEPTTGLIFPCVSEGSASQVVVLVIRRVINWLLALSGTLFLVMFVWGGFQYIISSGDSTKADKGRKTLINAIMGVAIILFSYVFLDYVFGAFITALGK